MCIENMPDHELVQKYLESKDEKYFLVIFKRYEKLTWYMAKKYFENWYPTFEVEDIQADLTLRILEVLHKFDHTRGTFRKWITFTLDARCKRILDTFNRREGRHKFLSLDREVYENDTKYDEYALTYQDVLPNKEDTPEYVAMKDRLMRALKRINDMPEMSRKIFVMRFVQNMKVHDIAELIGMSRVQVLKYLSEIRRKLKEHDER